MDSDKICYNRILSGKFADLLKERGSLRWLLEFVKTHDDLDFLTGRNNQKEWISVYRGLSRLITINPANKLNRIRIDGAEAYKELAKNLYGEKDLSATQALKVPLSNLLENVRQNGRFTRFYNNKKEGFHQNKFSRQYGMCGGSDSDFVIVDKEVVIGYSNKDFKNKKFKPTQKKYKEIQKKLSELNPKKYGIKLEKKSLGGELDFLAVDKKGNILLIEFKHGTNASGIYLSPLQIGLYHDIFSSSLEKETLLKQLRQRQCMGLINPAWPIPEKLGEIIPVLIISECSCSSLIKNKYNEVLSICRRKFGNNFLKNINVFNYTQNKLIPWENEIHA